MTVRIIRPDTSASSVRILSGSSGVVDPFGVNEIRVRVANNSVEQGLMALPLHIESSDPAAAVTEFAVSMQGGTPFEPRTVLFAAGDSLSLHWHSHPLGSYDIWTALPNDTTFVAFVEAVADTYWTFIRPVDLERIYAVTLTGANAPGSPDESAQNTSPLSKHKLNIR